MTGEVQRDMEWSARKFRTLVWPEIASICGGGRIELVEDRDKSTLDMYAGIDAWQVFDRDRAMRGIASRIQPDRGKVGFPYNTFSIRLTRPACPTEYEKRRDAIRSDRGMIWPHLTVQAYLDSAKNQIVSAGVVKTKDLYEYIESRGLKTFREIQNADRSSTFIVVPWVDLIRSSVLVRCLPEKPVARIPDLPVAEFMKVANKAWDEMNPVSPSTTTPRRPTP